MNPAIILTRNNLNLTKRAVDTVRKQDIEGGADLWIIDNGSKDGTWQWLLSNPEPVRRYTINEPPKSVSASWNFGLNFCFRNLRADYALVLNNDIELRPDTYRHLVADGGGFVTGVGSDDYTKIVPLEDPDPAKKRKHPSFSCFLIRREVFEKVGPFDERFEGAYCEDMDYHMRMHAAGIEAMCLELPFFHHISATVKNADPIDRRSIQIQADKNRALFKQIYGFECGSPEYYAALSTTPY
jgi:GT2 family glycosyltransferase